jgi:hypothetical protein
MQDLTNSRRAGAMNVGGGCLFVDDKTPGSTFTRPEDRWTQYPY